MKYQQSSLGRKVQAAVIGCGRMGAFTSQSVRDFAPTCWFPLSHVEAVKSFDNIDISGVCDVNPEILKSVGKTYNISSLYTDPKTMLQSREIDLLCIATRTQGRADLINLAFQNGVRAFHIEKPICNSVAELDRLSKILRRDDVYVTYGTIRRSFGPYIFAKELSDRGEIGKLRSIFVDHGEGMLLWTHPHSVDLCLYFTDGLKHNDVSASFSEINFDADSNIIQNDPYLNGALISFENDVTAHIGCAAGMTTRLVGTDGEIAIERDGYAVTVRRYDDHNPYLFSENRFDKFETLRRNGTGAAIDLLLGCIDGDAPSRQLNISMKNDILRGQKIIFDLARSGISNTSIRADIFSEEDFTILGEISGKYA